MDGLCDVTGCTNRVLLGWRPLTERIGRKVCEKHWHRHKDEQDSFDLFEVFGFRRPEGIRKPVARKYVPCCACGRELLPGRRFCTVCAAGRERLRKKRAYHERKNKQKPVEEITLRCRQCGKERNPGHIYCLECAKHRKTMTRRQAQSRYWRKQQNVRV